jgi:SSS family transporter
VVDPIVIALFAVYFIITIGIGIYSARFQKSMADFYVAGRQVGPFMVAFSACATIASGFFFVGLPGLCYLFGYQPMLGLPVNAVLAYVIVFGLLAKPMRYLSEKYDVLTVPDLYELLYETKTIRWISSIIIIFGIFGFMVSQWVAMGVMFQTLLHSTYLTGLIVGVAVVGFYVVMGGQLGNMWVSSFQMVVMIVGAVIALIYGFGAVGGFTEMNKTLGSYKPEILLPFSSKFGLNIWTYISFFLLYAIGTVGQPHFITRFFTIKKIDQLRWTPAISAVAYVFITLFLMTGMIYKAAELKGIVEPLKNPDMAVSQFLVKFMPVGVGGLVLAAAVAAIMSTVSAFIIVSASTLARDLLQKGFNIHLTESQGVLYSRISTIIMCLVTVLFAIKPPDLVAWLGNAAFGFFAAGLGPAIVAGVRWRRANKYGAMASMVIGSLTALTLYVLKVQKVYVPKLDTGAIAFLVSIAVIIIISLITPYQKREALPGSVKEI